MAFDFPASPANGQTYTKDGVTYVWNGYAWMQDTTPSSTDALLRSQHLADLPNKPLARTNLGVSPYVAMVAGRAVGHEVLPMGNYPILGAYRIARGGWTSPAGHVTVPVSGLYRITNRIYVNGQSANARVSITVNGAGQSAFIQIPANAGTYEGTELMILTAGNTLAYNISMADCVLYSAANHTEVSAQLLEAF